MNNITKEELLALKAVSYGARTNDGIYGGDFVEQNYKGEYEEINFVQAMNIIEELIARLEDDCINEK